jgi:hypothetical protein
MKESLQTHIIKVPRLNDEWGSTINNRNKKTTKIYFQNINGLQEKQFHGRWTDQLKYMEKYNIEICGLAETNTDRELKILDVS